MGLLTEETNDRGYSVVISQPMYFPWVGLLEQIRLSDIFVFYDDVQFSKGFFNRVQVKTRNGMHWMTVPLSNLHRGQLINEVVIDNREDWKERHRGLLKQAYGDAPFYSDVVTLVDQLFSQSLERLSTLSQRSMLLLAEYFGLVGSRKFYDSSSLGVAGRSSQRLLDIVMSLGGKRYITGHGARNYMDHALFDQKGVIVEYMDYEMKEYRQMYGEFTPYVTALDLVANHGREGAEVIRSGTVGWRKFLASTSEGLDRSGAD